MARSGGSGRGGPVDGDEHPVPASSPAGGAGWRLFRGALLVLATAGTVLALVLGTQAAGWWPALKNPFTEQRTDRSQPALLTSIRDLSRYVAAEGSFQVVIDLERDRRYVPDWLLSERTLFVAAGTVQAYVDFSVLGQGAVIESADRRRVEVTLPAPALDRPNLDQERSYVFTEERGVINRVGDFFGGDPNRAQQLYVLAEQKMAEAAMASTLAEQARRNTHDMLHTLLRSLGYPDITITFASP